MNNEKKKNNIISFPDKLSNGEREVEAIIFAAAEPLDVDTIEQRVSKKIDINKILKKLQNIYESHLKKNPDKFEKMDMTNFFNFLIKKNFAIFFTKSNKQWYEFDDKGDLDSFLVK